MTKTTWGSIVLATLLTAAPNAHAQALPEWTRKVNFGKPIFVTTSSGERVEGVAGQTTEEGVVVATAAGIRTVKYDDVQKVQKRDPKWTGAVLGGIIGAAVGTGYVLNTNPCQTDACRNEEGAVPFAGAFWGGMIGWGIDAWFPGRTTLFDRNVTSSISLKPARGGFAAGVAFTW